MVSSPNEFGGYGLYREGLMFALIAGEVLYFKTDAASVAQFEQAGSLPFVYQSATRLVRMSYWSAPAESLESPAETKSFCPGTRMCGWCQLAYAAALRAHVGARPKVLRTAKLVPRSRKAK